MVMRRLSNSAARMAQTSRREQQDAERMTEA